MLGDVDAAFADAVQRASGGNPRLAVEESCAPPAPAARAPTANDVGTLDGHDLTALVAAALARLPPPARRLADALAVIGRAASVVELAALLDDDAAVALGRRARRARRRCRRLRRARGPPALSLGGARRRRLRRARAAPPPGAASPRARRADRRPDAVIDRARHLVALAAPDAAERRRSPPASSSIERGRCAPPSPCSRRPRSAAPALCGCARRCCSAGRARSPATTPARSPRSPPPRPRTTSRSSASTPTHRRRARAATRRRPARRRGAPASPLVAAARAAPSRRARATKRAACSAVSSSTAATTPRAAEVCAASEEPSAAVAEARGLACLYLGRFDDADVAFAAVERAAAGHPPQLGRARNLRGMVAHSRDALAEAAALYQSALTLARGADDLHAAAIYAMNLGAILREAAEYERALGPSRRRRARPRPPRQACRALVRALQLRQHPRLHRRISKAPSAPPPKPSRWPAPPTRRASSATRACSPATSPAAAATAPPPSAPIAPAPRR